MDTQAPAATQPLTGEALFEMPGADRCELVEGEIKRRSPTGWKHGTVEARLAQRLGDFVEEHDLGEVMVGEVGIYTGRDPDTVRAADVLFISHERLKNASPDGFLDVAPALVVEIMSPSNAWEDVRQKIEEYVAIGVEQVWIVEPANRAVLVYRARDAVHTLAEDDTLNGEGPLEGFTRFDEGCSRRKPPALAGGSAIVHDFGTDYYVAPIAKGDTICTGVGRALREPQLRAVKALDSRVTIARTLVRGVSTSPFA